MSGGCQLKDPTDADTRASYLTKQLRVRIGDIYQVLLLLTLCCVPSKLETFIDYSSLFKFNTNVPGTAKALCCRLPGKKYHVF